MFARTMFATVSKHIPWSHLLNIRQKVEELVFAGARQVGRFQDGHHGEVLIVGARGAGGARVSFRGPIKRCFYMLNLVCQFFSRVFISNAQNRTESLTETGRWRTG